MSCSSCKSAAPDPHSATEGAEHPEFPSAATNPCKLCTPLGACLAFKGIAGAVPLLHGSQGCATYIRRYLISHYREPIDIASTNFSEDSAVFGGRKNLHTALDNVSRQYRPALIGIATTCLSETMGENLPMLLAEYRREDGGLRTADCGLEEATNVVARGAAARLSEGLEKVEGERARGAAASPPPKVRSGDEEVAAPTTQAGDEDVAAPAVRMGEGLEGVARERARGAAASPPPKGRSGDEDVAAPTTQAGDGDVAAPVGRNPEGAALVHVSTPSFKGTHAEGFHAAVRALVEALAGTAGQSKTENPKSKIAARLVVLPGLVSPADLRHLRDFCAAWGEGSITLLPDYAETLDGPSWSDFVRTPAGGTPLDELRALDRARAVFEFGHSLAGAEVTAGTHLFTKFGVPLHRLGLPVGLRATDAFCAALSERCPAAGASLLALAEAESPASRPRPGEPSFRIVLDSRGREFPMPERLAAERGRLIDSYVDAHKYLAGKKAVVYGEDDLVAGLAVFLAETGVTPVLVASGERNRRLADAIFAAAPELRDRIEVREGSDFGDIEQRVAELKPDLLLGSSKGYRLARSLGVPLVRCGFPVHDRLGAQRLQLLGYAGTQQLFDRIVNALLEAKQENSDIGYSYL